MYAPTISYVDNFEDGSVSKSRLGMTPQLAIIQGKEFSSCCGICSDGICHERMIVTTVIISDNNFCMVNLWELLHQWQFMKL